MAFDDGLLQLAKLPNLEARSIGKTMFSPVRVEHRQHVKQLRWLRSLYLADAGRSHGKRLTSRREFEVGSRESVTSAAVAHLRSVELEILGLERTEVDHQRLAARYTDQLAAARPDGHISIAERVIKAFTALNNLAMHILSSNRMPVQQRRVADESVLSPTMPRGWKLLSWYEAKMIDGRIKRLCPPVDLSLRRTG